jgi:hypothetical protein
MEKLMDKYKALEIAARIRLGAKLEAKGKQSKHSNTTVLKIKKDQQFNLDGGRWLTEISAEHLIDDCGYTYDHSVITIEQFCQAIDKV